MFVTNTHQIIFLNIFGTLNPTGDLPSEESTHGISSEPIQIQTTTTPGKQPNRNGVMLCCGMPSSVSCIQFLVI